MAQALLQQHRSRAVDTDQLAIDDTNFQSHLSRALKLIGSMLKLFSLEQIALTFNGGKDACVVFHLVRAAIAEMLSSARGGGAVAEAEVAEALRRMKVLYFEPAKEFAEITDFMAEVSTRYGFEYTVYKCSYKEGMADLVSRWGVKAVVMGMRKGDPYTEESERLEPSSDGWPPFLRVYPILSWDYGYVWTFLRGYGLEYCVLYDRGFTSIGDYHNTVQNPALLCPSTGRYLPAHSLKDYSLERVNRRAATDSEPTSVLTPLHHFQVRLLCVSDLFLPPTNQDLRPITVARQLRELGCTVPSVVVVPAEHERVKAVSVWCRAGPLLILTTDDRGATVASEMLEQWAAEAEAPGSSCQSAITPTEAVTAAPPSPTSSPIKPRCEDGAHAKRLRHSVVLLPSFNGLSLAEQRSSLGRLLGQLASEGMADGGLNGTSR